MLESKLWQSKPETKNIKVSIGGIYQNFSPASLKVQFWSYFQLHSPLPLCWGKINFQKTLRELGEMGNLLLP